MVSRAADVGDEGEARRDDDDACLRGLREGREEALDTVVRRYGNALARTAWLLLRDVMAAEDAAQQALVAAWHGARRAAPDTSLRPWLFGILFNVCRHWARSEGRRKRHEREAGRQYATRAGEASSDVGADGLAAALARLPPRWREVVVARFYEGLNVADTAAALGIAEGTVKSRTNRALARLRAELTDDKSCEGRTAPKSGANDFFPEPS